MLPIVTRMIVTRTPTVQVKNFNLETPNENCTAIALIVFSYKNLKIFNANQRTMPNL